LFAIQVSSREAKLSLLACVSASSDLRPQELFLQLRFGNIALQIQDNDFSILSDVWKQLSTLSLLLDPSTKNQLQDYTKTQSDDHLQTLPVQSKS